MAMGGESCLIAGCGYTGARLARRQLGPVLALVRGEASAEALRQDGISAVAADLDGESPTFPAHFRMVAYTVPPGGCGPVDLRMGRFLAALGEARPRAFLYLSATSVYGDTNGASVDESAPVAPADDRARQRLDAETSAQRWCADRGIPCAVFRVAAIYGPHRLPVDRVRRGEPVIRPEDTGPGNRIHVDDLVEACGAALGRGAAGIFNLADGYSLSPAEFTERTAALTGLPLPPRIPWSEAERVFSPAYLAFFREHRRVVPGRLHELGVRPRSPEKGLLDSLREMGLA
jgi:nucleoside-diphosphate-sugar epimerase